MVIVQDTSEADLRFAVNTDDDQRRTRSRRVTVVRMSERPGRDVGRHLESQRTVDIDDLLAAAEHGRPATPHRPTDASPLIEGGTSD